MIQNKLSWWQWSLIGIGGLLVLLGIPYLLNHFIQQPQLFPIVGEGKDWLLFWSAWLGAISSFAMVIATFITLRQNKKIIEEQNRPRLNFSIFTYQKWYHIKISNMGKENAFDIKVEFEQSFINNLPKQKYKKTLTSLQSRPFCIEAGKSNYYIICCQDDTKYYWGHKMDKINIKGSYCNRYQINESFSIDEYVTESIIVNDNLTTAFEYYKKGVTVQNDQYMPIQKSLDMIAKKIEQIKIEDNGTK